MNLARAAAGVRRTGEGSRVARRYCWRSLGWGRGGDPCRSRRVMGVHPDQADRCASRPSLWRALLSFLLGGPREAVLLEEQGFAGRAAKPAVRSVLARGQGRRSTVGSEVQPCDRQARAGLLAFTHRFPPSRRPAQTGAHPPIHRGGGSSLGDGCEALYPILGLAVPGRALVADALQPFTRQSPSRMASDGGSGPVRGLGCVRSGGMTCVREAVPGLRVNGSRG